MKKLYLILAFMSAAFFANAQREAPAEKKQQDIEALKVAFISRELELTPEEAQRFWPIYNEYSKEINGVVKDDQDVLETDNKVLSIKNKYKDQFTKVLGPNKTNKMFNAENRFRKVLIKTMRNQRPMQQQQQHNNPNKPHKRNG
jgi:hypothetical protein